VGQAFSFDGVASSVDVPHNSALLPSVVTVEAWVNPGLLGKNQTIVSKEGVFQSGQIGYGLRQRADGSFWFVLGTDGADFVAQSTTTAQVGQWFHLAGVYDGASMKLYVNGVLESTVNVGSITMNSTSPLRIGALPGYTSSSNGFEFFQGLVDEATIYNRALTPAEIQFVYNQGSAGKPNDLGNAADGVLVQSGAASNTIGGTVASVRNVVAGNKGIGIHILGSGTNANVVAADFVGTNAAGTLMVGNDGSGIQIEGGAQNNTVGGAVAGAGNVISGNQRDGVSIYGNGTSGNLVAANTIGLDATGTFALGNLFSGVAIDIGA